MDPDYCLQALEWDKKQDYTQGLRLWKERYGENMLYRLFCRSQIDLNRKKMREGIMAGVAKPVEQSKPAQAEKPAADLPVENQATKDDISNLDSDISDLRWQVDDLEERLDKLTGVGIDPEPKPEKQPDEPAEIKKMRESTYGLMDERTALKQRLRDLPDPARRPDRKLAALRILDITDQLDILFAKLDYYRDHKRVPENAVIFETDVKLPKKYLNIRTYISRTLSKLKKTTEPGRRIALEKLLETHRLKLKEIETEL